MGTYNYCFRERDGKDAQVFNEEAELARQKTHVRDRCASCRNIQAGAAG